MRISVFIFLKMIVANVLFLASKTSKQGNVTSAAYSIIFVSIYARLFF